MRLQSLGLEFFGHFSDKWLEFGERKKGKSDFHLIYGKNEAGKTTIMEGYLRLLYGFRHSEPYGFKHGRANLKVSADLQLNNAVRRFSRLPGRKGSLVDQSDTPISETAITGALSGLDIDDYRSLLCLDDETLESGGQDIANSKGDIGRLLFSAAAAVSDISGVLNEVSERAGGLYKKGGTKSQFAQQKREFQEINDKIRETDMSAADYKKRKEILENAVDQEKTNSGKTAGIG